MANEVIEETVVKKRVEAIASRESSFYTLSNRIIMILLPISIFTFVPISRTPAIITLAVIFLEIVLRYALKTTLKDAIKSIWLKIFGTKRKSVRN